MNVWHTGHSVCYALHTHRRSSSGYTCSTYTLHLLISILHIIIYCVCVAVAVYSESETEKVSCMSTQILACHALRIHGARTPYHLLSISYTTHYKYTWIGIGNWNIYIPYAVRFVKWTSKRVSIECSVWRNTGTIQTHIHIQHTHTANSSIEWDHIIRERKFMYLCVTDIWVAVAILNTVFAIFTLTHINTSIDRHRFYLLLEFRWQFEMPTLTQQRETRVVGGAGAGWVSEGRKSELKTYDMISISLCSLSQMLLWTAHRTSNIEHQWISKWM